MICIRMYIYIYICIFGHIHLSTNVFFSERSSSQCPVFCMCSKGAEEVSHLTEPTCLLLVCLENASCFP